VTVIKDEAIVGQAAGASHDVGQAGTPVEVTGGWLTRDESRVDDRNNPASRSSSRPPADAWRFGDPFPQAPVDLLSEYTLFGFHVAKSSIDLVPEPNALIPSLLLVAGGLWIRRRPSRSRRSR
jgi:hypothetical protein